MKAIFPGTTIFATTSLRLGLLLIAAPFMQTIIRSAAARAQHLYPITICDIIVNQNHIHFIIYVEDPSNVADFFERFKTETAHAINRLLGRKLVSIWCDGYDSPTILTLEDTVKKIAYLYNNSSNDYQTENIDQYPNFNTWEVRKSANLDPNYVVPLKCPHVRRCHIEKLERLNLTRYEQELVNQRLLTQSESIHELLISPNAWTKAFHITDPVEVQEHNKGIVDLVRLTEKDNAAVREKEKKSVVGRERLLSAAMNLDFVSERDGQKMHCICSNIILRIVFLTWLKDLFAQGREVLRKWREFDFSVRYPIGLFAPSMPSYANLMPGAAFGG